MSRLKLPIVLGVLTVGLVALPVFAQSTDATPSAQSSASSQSTPTSSSQSAAQDQSNPSSASQSSPSSSSSASSMSSGSMSSQTFNGKISKSGGKYVLKDTATQTTYTLDDQDRAKQYEGKTVKVTGSLDSSSNTIRVASIEPGS
jgi:hypothetical protein